MLEKSILNRIKKLEVQYPFIDFNAEEYANNIIEELEAVLQYSIKDRIKLPKEHYFDIDTLYKHIFTPYHIILIANNNVLYTLFLHSYNYVQLHLIIKKIYIIMSCKRSGNMLLLSYIKKETLKNEIENLEKNINELNKNKKNLEKEISDMLDKKNYLSTEINKILDKKTKLYKDIKNRENFFIEHELMVIDTLTGIEFENYFATILKKLGYDANVTKASNDDGGDIIASKDNTTYVFQCKNYSDAVGNKAIQEVYSAKGIYKCDEAIVITNNYFTKQAKKEAEILSVTLWDRDILAKLLFEAFDFDLNNIEKRIYINKYSNKSDKEILEAEECDEIDPFLNEAIEAVIDMGQASASAIQRKFKVGYARAGRIIDQMEELGVISGYQGSKPREVLMTRARWEELKINI